MKGCAHSRLCHAHSFPWNPRISASLWRTSVDAGGTVATALLQGLAQPSASARLLAGLAAMHWAKAAAPLPGAPGAPAAAAAVPGSVVQAILAALAVPGARSASLACWM